MLSLRLLLRDLRAGELTALMLALVVAVASVASVGFITDRVRLALDLNAHELLGADLQIQADRPLPAELRAEAVARGLRVSEGVAFMSMARTPGGAQLCAVKAVGAGYPLRGELRIAAALGAAERVAPGIPAPGTLWVDARFIHLTGVRGGEQVHLGDAGLTVAAVLTHEPERGSSLFNLAPRVLLHLDDLPATGLIQPGSRVRYLLYVAGDAARVADYRAWLEPRLQRGQRLMHLADARPELKAALERARTFLALAALLAVILAAVSISLATRRYVERHYDGFAVMRCLGASQARLMRLFSAQFVLLGALAGVLGSVLGYAAQAAIGPLVASLIDTRLPPPSAWPALHGLLIAYVLLLGFAWPPLLKLKSVPALRVLRRDAGSPQVGPLLLYAAGLAAMAGLLVWQTGDGRLAAYALGGFTLAGAGFALLGAAALGLLAGLGGHAGFVWRYGLANLRRHWRANTLQLVALALGLTAILLLSFTRNDLIDAWQARIPPHAPNHFVLNIQPAQLPEVRAFFQAEGLTPPFYPMTRAHLLAINGRAVQVEDDVQGEARNPVEREINLSAMSRLPAHNRLVEGRWFDAAQMRHGALSIEAGFARALGVGLGDRLTWSVAGETFTAPVTSVRQLDWESMQVNFFVIATPALLADAPVSHLTSVRIEPAQAPILTRLVARFPNLTVIDTSTVLNQLMTMMQRMVTAVQYVFLFALGAGVLVLYTALLARHDERLREAALLRTLGARRAQVAAAQRTEHLALGGLAGVLAATAAAAIGGVLASRVFELDAYLPDPWLWPAGLALGLASALLSLRLSARAALDSPPALVLRQ